MQELCMQELYMQEPALTPPHLESTNTGTRFKRHLPAPGINPSNGKHDAGAEEYVYTHVSFPGAQCYRSLQTARLSRHSFVSVSHV